MKVKDNISGETYKKLVHYAAKKCNCILLKKYCDLYRCETERELRVIYSNPIYTKEIILQNYSEKFLEKISNDFRDSKAMFDFYIPTLFEKKYFSLVQKTPEEDNYFHRDAIIISAVERLMYEERINVWKNLYRDSIKKEKEILLEDYTLFQINYFLKIDRKTINMLFERDSLFDWIYPYSIEDLCFLKSGHYWLESVAHENLCFINCEDEEEYEYLKSLGIVFEEDHFVPQEKYRNICEEH